MKCARHTILSCHVPLEDFFLRFAKQFLCALTLFLLRYFRDPSWSLSLHNTVIRSVKVVRVTLKISPIKWSSYGRAHRWVGRRINIWGVLESIEWRVSPLPYPGGLGAAWNTWQVRGVTPPPPSYYADAHFLIICGAAAWTVVVVPIIIPPPILLLRNGASLVSSVSRGSPPLGIDARQRRKRRSQGVHICLHPKDGGHIRGWLFR